MTTQTPSQYLTKLQHRLALAERHVVEGEAHIRRYRMLVSDLERGGHETRSVRESLKQFEQLQKLHLDDLARLRDELALWDEPAYLAGPLVPSE